MPPIIVNVAIPLPLSGLFDYLPPTGHEKKVSAFQKGVRVQVPFGRRQVIGFVVSTHQRTELPRERLKAITAILDEVPLLPPTVMQLIEWVSRYYHHSLGETIETALPARLRRLQCPQANRSNTLSHDMDDSHANRLAPTLNEEQQRACHAVEKHLNQFGVFLLAGVTGSGKTEVYLRLIQTVLDIGKQVLLLVPEISLTPQIVERLQQRLGKEKIAVSHSKLTDLQRLNSWEAIRSGKKLVMVGTRSVVFTPFKRLGLIIIDEEHDHSFKQQGSLNYHARDVSIVRARFEKVPIVLGSATPSLESIYNATYGHYRLLTLSQRAGQAGLPTMAVIDLRKQRLQVGLSETLLQWIQQHLASKGQVLLFLNRRGFSPIYLCHGCGWVMMCSACDSPFRFHTRPNRLCCHYCQKITPLPLVCPNCHQDQLFALGQGTQRLESFLQNYFPDVALIRIDADSTRGKGKLTELLARTRQGEPAILVGTQLLAKGHHFPDVTLAAIIDGDAGLFGTDFRSLEQAAQMIMQVGGRAGRADRAGTVIIQTHHPSHPLLRQLIEKGYTQFSQLALKERQQANWPPFSYLALLRVDSRTKKSGMCFLDTLKPHCLLNPAVSVLGPVPALASKRVGYYRAQLLFQSRERRALHSVLKRVMQRLQRMPNGVRCHLDVDPLEVC